MKRYLFAFAASAVLAAGAATAAKAVEFDVGPGGVRVGPGYHDRYYRDRDAYGRGGCRVVIDHHTNRYGEDVTVRRRVCD